MQVKSLFGAVCVLLMLLITGAFGEWSTSACAADKPLSGPGQQLEASYAEQLKSLRAEITASLPKFDEQQVAAFHKARADLKLAESAADAALKPLGNIQTAKALVEHAKGKWIKGAEQGIAQAEAALKKATNDAERTAAQKDLAKWQANKEDGLHALKERQAALDKALLEQTKLAQANEAAKAALVKAQSNEIQAAKTLLTKASPILLSEKLDAKLVKCAVLTNATPRGLAEFAQQSSEHQALVDKLLGSESLMKQMLEAGGAKDNQYGQAVKIYAAIRKASPRSKEGIFHRLALGISLEHAVPIAQRNAVAATTAPTTVDPVKRYLHYEQAYLAGELDPVFKDMTAWECRLIVRCDAPDDVLAWGRQMLRNYRPDHVNNPDYGWRYSGMVRTDVEYRHSHLLQDDDSLEFFQNICKEGGICGRRAFFGRFILQSFGIPTVERPQRGHAALAHWTPTGWVINLGAGWGYHEAKGVLGLTDEDFLLETQVRKFPLEHLQAMRAQWIGDILGEKKYESMKPGSGGLWNVLSMYQKQTIVAKAKPVKQAALGQELGEANESVEARSQAVVKATVTAADKKINIASNGVITIPAAACSGVQILGSYLGGHQLFSGNGAINFDVELPSGGKYALTARVVTVRENPNVLLTTNNAKTPIEFPIPYTIGKWEQTQPVQVTLVPGKNSLRLTRPAGSHGLTIKDFTLTPVK